STNTIVLQNWMGLSGTNIYVNVNDTGVDVSHPDLVDRVLRGPRTSATDPDGHGTHVAGIVASSGLNGPTGPVPGSLENANFRGMAHGSTILSFDVFEFFDWELQEFPARTNLVLGKTNALISNNSWSYIRAYGYNSAAASFDAAVRDAIPGMTGSQPVLFVFAAGNDGAGEDDGSGGFASSVSSPATAKNVITVGALESFRNITNEVIQPNRYGIVTTNAEFWGLTDSSNQVVHFSGRGNVGIGIEGDFGRFKPDVVAPGSFAISTRSGQWDTNDYYSTVSRASVVFTNLVIERGDTNFFSLLMPYNTIEYFIGVYPNEDSPDPMPPLRIYTNIVRQPSTNVNNFAGTNSINVADEAASSLRNQRLFFDIVNTNNFDVPYDLGVIVWMTNDYGNLFEVLDSLNEGLGNGNPPPKYRYESGTSMAAPVVSGMLALLQEYFETQTPEGTPPPSPALMKALLINSARSAGGLYDYKIKNNINFQGWGLPN
ncbi:MAG: S8 family serine peptidase, partial [Limisphaerales bacterium]